MADVDEVVEPARSTLERVLGGGPNDLGSLRLESGCETWSLARWLLVSLPFPTQPAYEEISGEKSGRLKKIVAIPLRSGCRRRGSQDATLAC